MLIQINGSCEIGIRIEKKALRFTCNTPSASFSYASIDMGGYNFSDINDIRRFKDDAQDCLEGLLYHMQATPDSCIVANDVLANIIKQMLYEEKS